MAIARSNWMDLGFSKDVEERLRKAAELYRITYLDSIDTVFEIAQCIEILRTANYGTGVQGGFAEALVQYGFTNRDGGPIDKSIRSNYKALVDHEDEVRAWWKTVPERRKRDWLSARAIYKNWQVDQKPPPTEAQKATAQARKIAAAQRVLGLRPEAPVPIAADWVPAGFGAKPSVEAIMAKQAANAEEEAAAAEEGIDYIDALTSINAVKNETTPAEFAAALREFAENDAAKLAGLEGNIDGLLVFFDQVKAALAGPPPKPKKGKAKGKAKGEPKSAKGKKLADKPAAEEDQAASAAEPTALKWTGQHPATAPAPDGGKYAVFEATFVAGDTVVDNYDVQYTPAGTEGGRSIGKAKTSKAAKAIAERHFAKSSAR